MADVLGPASTGAVATRPDRSIVRGSNNTWFADCVEGDDNSGTVIPADWYNDMLAQVRTVLTNSGVVLDNADDMLWRALQTLGVRYGADGGTKNHIVATLSPALAAYTAGDLALVKIGNSVDGATDVNFNGAGVKSLVGYGGAALADGDLVAGDLALLGYDGSKWQVLQSGGWNTQAVVSGLARNLAASATGLSANVAVSADELVVLSAQNRFRRLTGVNVTINSASVGANGLDVGPLAPNTWYALYVIWNGATSAGLLSLSATAPTMPAGYTHKARVSWVRTDSSGNKYPLAFQQRGREVQYVIAGNVPFLPTMAAGAASIWTAVAVGNFVPPTAAKIALSLYFEGTEKSFVRVAPNNAYPVFSNSGGGWSGDGAGNPAGAQSTRQFVQVGMGANVGYVDAQIPFAMLLESTNIYYASLRWSGTSYSELYCVGWLDNF